MEVGAERGGLPLAEGFVECPGLGLRRGWEVLEDDGCLVGETEFVGVSGADGGLAGEDFGFVFRVFRGCG